MRQHCELNSERRSLAERLIKEARALLSERAEEIAAIHLDHALAALEDLDDASLPASPSR
jgi:hypothetical protein